MTIKQRDFDKIVDKFQFETRHGRDLHAWLVFDGAVVVRTRRSKKRGDLPCQHAIRQQLKLNDEQIRDAVRCTLGFDDYIEILRDAGVIPPG